MAFCANCGKEISDRAPSCPNCGHPGPGAGVGGQLEKTEGNAIASLILGIAGFVVCPIVPSILAVIYGRKAQEKLRANPDLQGEGLAKAGVVLGWVGIGLVGAGLLFALIAVSLSGVNA